MPKYELIQADCLEAMKEITPGSVDLVLTDPPYGTTQCKWDAVIPFEPMWEQVRRALKPNGAAVFTASQPFTSALVMSNPKAFKCSWVWEKSKCGSPGIAAIMPMRFHEDVLVFSANSREKTSYFPQMEKGGTPYKRFHKASKTHKKNEHGTGFSGGAYSESKGERYPRSVQFFAQNWRRQDQVHPTQKPVALMEYLIRTYTRFGETVLDFTMGSGTTGVAAMNTGRNFIGIEREPKYFEIAKKRIEDAAREAEEWEDVL